LIYCTLYSETTWENQKQVAAWPGFKITLKCFILKEIVEEEAPRYCTFQRVSGEAQLADDVAGDVCLDDLAHLGMVLCCL
jgi:hypothetical protein